MMEWWNSGMMEKQNTRFGRSMRLHTVDEQKDFSPDSY
jgi:hypothetical protein